MHIVADVTKCSQPWKLDDEYIVLSVLTDGAISCGATILGKQSHKFTPQGVTAIIMLAESHISIHTWPENGSYALDAYTCGEMDCEYAFNKIFASLGGGDVSKHVLHRSL